MPNRIIKESICSSESLNSLSDFQENFFYHLIVNCDDYGRLDARPAILKARLYPLRDRLTFHDIECALQALVTVGCVDVYTVDGKPYLQLPTWEVHQQIRAKKSKFPAKPIECNQRESACNQMIADDSTCPRNPIQSKSESETGTEYEERGADAPPPEPPPPPEDAKRKHGTYGWVRLSDAEYRRLISEFGNETASHYITVVDELAQQTGNKNKWKDWNLTVRKAIRDYWGSGYSQAKGGNGDGAGDTRERSGTGSTGFTPSTGFRKQG